MKFSFTSIDRRIVYLLVALALGIPLAFNYTVKPARMRSAEELHALVNSLSPTSGKIAWVALDFGPSTKAENQPQAEVMIEHLLRRRIPFLVSSLLAESGGLVTAIPQKIVDRLQRETGEAWEYGVDWINIGYRPGAGLFIQSLSKSEDLAALIGKDAFGSNVADLPAFKGVRTLRDVHFLFEVTGSVGVFSSYVQFFRSGDTRPKFGHACTSITVPEAYIYLDAKQLDGLLEGLSGAAWYSHLLREEHVKRAPDTALVLNTGLGVAQLLIIILILCGNLGALFQRRGA